jgi:hypothetical protein
LRRSAHDRYRTQLELLATDEPILDALGLDAGWRRATARFHPDADPWGSLTLEKWGRRLRVDVFDGPRFVATPAEDDLPALRPLLAAGAEIVRYHPGLRCTVRLGERFGKVGDDGMRLLTLQRAIWMHRAEFAFAVAEPLEASADVLWLRAVPGERAGSEHAESAGEALASLHRSSLRTAPFVDRTARAAAGLVRIVPSLEREVARLLVPIAAGSTRPLHGAPHPPQWLADGDRLGLIDFDRLGMGDVEWDVAAYVEAARAEDGGEEVAAAFLRGYGPLDSRRLSAYRGRRRILKALRAATALRADGDERAARRLRGG